MHPVLDLIEARHAARSLPGRRDDGARLAVVIEGGSSRAAFGGGMVCALEDRGLVHTFDAVYGSSAGALNGAWLVCGKANSGVHGWWTPEIMNSVIAPLRLLRGRPVVDTDYLVDHIYRRVTPMGFDEILASPIEYHPMATCAESGDAVDLATLIHDRATLEAALRASTRLPILAGRPVEIAGRHFLDAGIAEGVPVRTALAQGATHVLALRTRHPRSDAQKPSQWEQRVVHSWLVRRAPGAVTAWASRHERHLQEEFVLANDPRVLQIAPPADAPTIGLTSRATEILRQAVDIGRASIEQTLGGTVAPGWAT